MSTFLDLQSRIKYDTARQTGSSLSVLIVVIKLLKT